MELSAVRRGEDAARGDQLLEQVALRVYGLLAKNQSLLLRRHLVRPRRRIRSVLH